jgi:DNA mismatch repair ATPase MutS
MLDQKKGGGHPDVVSPTRPYGEANRDGNHLDQAGQTILQLLGKAADITESNSRHGMEKVQRLSQELRFAEDRIKQLEAEVASSHEKAERAEQWLHKVYTEIQDRFLQAHARQAASR